MEEYNFDSFEEYRDSVNRYEEMLRNEENYFFDSQAFEGIIDYYIEANEAVKALQVIEYALSQHHFEGSFHLKKAQILLALNNYEDALIALKTAELLEPSEFEIILTKASIYSKLKNFDAAIAILNDALYTTEDENKIEVYFQLAALNQERNSFYQAIHYLERILEMDKDNEDALIEIEECYDNTGNFEKAIEFFKAYINTNPYSYLAWHILGNTYHKIEKYELAIDAYDYVILINEDYEAAYYNKGNALVSLEKYAEAIEVYKKTFEYQTPSADTYCALGDCYERLNELEQAREYYKKAVKSFPFMGDAWLGIGSTLEQEGRNYEAVHYFKKAIRTNSKEEEYWYALANVRYKIGQLDLAEEAYQEVIAINTDAVDAWLDYSSLLIEQNRVAEAISLIENAILHNEESDELYYRMVLYYFLDGSYELAINYLEVALSLNPENHYLIFESIPKLKDNVIIKEIIKKYIGE
ncbi:MAG TPA: tetratricopeptide repeat protein [Candidatus Sphingobacterium stercoripullorum]|uniref:Tetratricopeptide repeat protein n=1 Tax=Candidatus Sphingobacterium stercoripullorum TaxID=2838759 RepID=A0A9D1W8K0_9SPHI|nr:tetratricopeptide repeat protein [Candidatus Sphingobacterium stercoripullorum]HLR49267.1 tetratricopeptide repeat protein [Candidatus Sphingobacterium stercoripullorum]